MVCVVMHPMKVFVLSEPKKVLSNMHTKLIYKSIYHQKQKTLIINKRESSIISLTSPAFLQVRLFLPQHPFSFSVRSQSLLQELRKQSVHC